MIMKNALQISVLVLVLVGVSAAGWDEVPRPRANPDIATFLVPVPQDTIDTHGNTDRTKVMFNLALIRQACQTYEDRLKALEAKVEELTVKVAMSRDDDITIADGELIDRVKEAVDPKGVPQ
jgi:hypothetical protein